MRHSRFSLADLLTVLGAAIFGFICFLSFNFLTMGKTVPSLVYAGVIALLLGGLGFGVKLLKKASGNFKTCIIWEWIFLLLFAGVSFIAVKPFSHYFAVLDQKVEIQSKVTANIDQAESIFKEYESYTENRETLYKKHLKSAVATKNASQIDYRKFGFVYGTPDSTQIENKIFTLHAQLYPTNYEGEDGIKQVATNWLANARNILKSKWAFTFGLVDVLNNLQSNITTWNNNLKQFSTFIAPGENRNDFDIPVTFDNITDKITELRSPKSLSIVIALSLYVLMLLSYFVTKRSTKNHYGLLSFIKNKKNSNQTGIDIEY